MGSAVLRVQTATVESAGAWRGWEGGVGAVRTGTGNLLLTFMLHKPEQPAPSPGAPSALAKARSWGAGAAEPGDLPWGRGARPQTVLWRNSRAQGWPGPRARGVYLKERQLSWLLAGGRSSRAGGMASVGRARHVSVVGQAEAGPALRAAAGSQDRCVPHTGCGLSAGLSVHSWPGAGRAARRGRQAHRPRLQLRALARLRRAALLAAAGIGRAPDLPGPVMKTHLTQAQVAAESDFPGFAQR